MRDARRPNTMAKDIIKDVYQIIKSSELPIDPNNLSKKARIGWGTALKYALTLVVEEKVRGLRTTKGWIFYEEK